MTELILALDVTEKKKALAIAHACAPYIDAIKVGYPLVLSSGLSIAGNSKKRASRSSPTSRLPISRTRTSSSASRCLVQVSPRSSATDLPGWTP